MISKITCFVVIVLICLTIPVFAQTNGGARASIGMMFSDASGPFLNLSGKLSTQETFNLMGSVGVGFDSDVTLIPVMLSIEPQPRSLNNWYFGAGLGLMFKTGHGWSGSDFAYQGYAGYNFSPKTFGEFKLIGSDFGTVGVISVGQKF